MYNNQRGGIVSFIIVAVALAGLLGGALYFSKQQGREARDATPAPQISQRDESKEETTKDEQPAENAPQSGTPQNNQAPTQPAAQNQQSQGATSPSTRTPSAGADRVANTGPSQDLPATGPAETTAVVLGLAALTFAGYMLLSSRRGLRRSALRK